MSSTQLDVAVNLLAGTVRGWRGTSIRGRARKAPEKLLKLYDIEVSPYCRFVREALTELDLDVLILPCPAGGTRFRPEAKALVKGTTFPMLVDENTGVLMNESADIIEYLSKTYEGRVKAAQGVIRSLAVGGSMASTLCNLRPSGLKGLKAQPSKQPELPLELYSFETSPYSKPVRARLCELELPYILRNTGKGALTDMGPPSFRDKLFKAPKGTTRNRKALLERTGKVQVPYLIDPNTGVEMYESGDILDYLNSTYAL